MITNRKTIFLNVAKKNIQRRGRRFIEKVNRFLPKRLRTASGANTTELKVRFHFVISTLGVSMIVVVFDQKKKITGNLLN
jgi:hypothetical protein